MNMAGGLQVRWSLHPRMRPVGQRTWVVTTSKRDLLAVRAGWQPLLLVTHNGSLETVEPLCAAEYKQQLLSRPSRRISFPENISPVGLWEGCKSHLNAVSCSVTWITLGFRRVVVLRTALFWVITQRVTVIPYTRFGAVYRSTLQRSKDPNGKSRRDR